MQNSARLGAEFRNRFEFRTAFRKSDADFLIRGGFFPHAEFRTRKSAPALLFSVRIYALISARISKHADCIKFQKAKVKFEIHALALVCARNSTRIYARVSARNSPRNFERNSERNSEHNSERKKQRISTYLPPLYLLPVLTRVPYVYKSNVSTTLRFFQFKI